MLEEKARIFSGKFKFALQIKVKRVPPRSSADKLSQHILEAMELSKLAS